MSEHNWIHHQREPETGIELLRAHFKGHAYDPHWHDSFLIGITEQGVQRFTCRKAFHNSTPGHLFTLNPGELHDGNAPQPEGFTYSSLYIDPHWLQRELTALTGTQQSGEPEFQHTLVNDPVLASAFIRAFTHISGNEPRMVRQAAIDHLLTSMTRHLHWLHRPDPDPRLPRIARLGRDYLQAHYTQDIGLTELSEACGVDRFRLSRAFKAAFGIAPHAYLIQLRLAHARRLIASGHTPSDIAALLGFADQSHLGRWFRRAYGLTPAHYARQCTKLPDK